MIGRVQDISIRSAPPCPFGQVLEIQNLPSAGFPLPHCKQRIEGRVKVRVKEIFPTDLKQLSRTFKHKAKCIDQTLEAHYGTPQRRRPRDPISSLIRTILSQNTSDVNSDMAFQRLKAWFPSWEDVRDAPLARVIAAIKPAGLANQKAPRIQKILRQITEERGELTLDFLGDMSVEEARAWLLKLDGVGPKTAAIVLLFALGKPAFPVDTHVYRVGIRLGLIPKGLSVEKAHAWMEKLVSPDRYGPFHLLLVRHGRQICKAQRPLCHICPLQRWCDWFRQGRAQPAPT